MIKPNKEFINQRQTIERAREQQQLLYDLLELVNEDITDIEQDVEYAFDILKKESLIDNLESYNLDIENNKLDINIKHNDDVLKSVLRQSVYGKIDYILSLIEKDNINDIVFIGQGFDSDCFCSIYILRNLLPQLTNKPIKTDKEVYFNFKNKIDFLNPLTNYLGGKEFSFDDDKLYIFCDNGLSQEAINHFKIKNYVEFDNHTRAIGEQTKLERLIKKNGLGDRNVISATCELLSVLDMSCLSAIELILFSSCDSSNILNSELAPSKIKQLNKLNINLTKHSFGCYKRYYSNKENKEKYQKINNIAKYNEQIKRIVLNQDINHIKCGLEFLADDIKMFIINILPQSVFEQSKASNNHICLDLKIDNKKLTKEQAIKTIKDNMCYEKGYKFNDKTDKVIIYNDNLYEGKTHYINSIITREQGFKDVGFIFR